MGLRHVVVTSVDRDDLPDRGAEHWARTIRALRRRLPAASIEVLTPDFRGREEEALVTVLGAHPHVFNHNIETVRRMQPRVRIKGDYDRALWLLRRAREVWDEHWPGARAADGQVGHRRRAWARPTTRSSPRCEDLRAHGVDVVTIGQYLQPTARHLPLDRWVPLDSFRRFREAGEQMGFGSVFSGPLVRSSYRAEEQQLAATGALRAGAL